MGERVRLVWMVAGIALLFVVGIVLFLRAGEDTSSTPTPTPGTTGTPLSIDPGAPTDTPDVSGRRTAAGVVFRWDSSDGFQAGDSWEWRRTDTGAGERTTKATVTINASKRVCLQVRLIHGSFASPWGNRCVD
jgi:eukaryotic-like serine/threonine-protein kinase